MVNLTVKLPDADGKQTWAFHTSYRIVFASGVTYNEAENLATQSLKEHEYLHGFGRETIVVIVG